jgi:Protein of unknown function (DUF2946)
MSSGFPSSICYTAALMHSLRLRTLQNKLSVWLAAFAILMAALAPSISQAVAARDGAKSSWIEVCSTGGSKFVRVLSDGQVEHGQPNSESSPHTGGCPFCGFHSELALPSAQATLTLSASPLDTRLHGIDLCVFISSWRWPSARSRAPPILS